jgi:predicted secreted acid phosphatase
MLKQDKNAKRNRIVDEHKRYFGTKFILLPNPMYGDWESNLAKKYRKLPAEQRIALRKAALKRFEIRDKRK